MCSVGNTSLSLRTLRSYLPEPNISQTKGKARSKNADSPGPGETPHQLLANGAQGLPGGAPGPGRLTSCSAFSAAMARRSYALHAGRWALIQPRSRPAEEFITTQGGPDGARIVSPRPRGPSPAGPPIQVDYPSSVSIGLPVHAIHPCPIPALTVVHTPHFPHRPRQGLFKRQQPRPGLRLRPPVSPPPSLLTPFAQPGFEP